MMQLHLPLSNTGMFVHAGDAELAPVAGVQVHVKGGKQNIELVLKGVISGASAERLMQFLQDMSRLLGNHWTLQMRDLVVISGRGLRGLVRFAKLIRKRGGRLVIKGVNENVFATLQDLNLVGAFAWAD